MKRFRTVTIFTLAAVAMMVVANVVYHSTLQARTVSAATPRTEYKPRVQKPIVIPPLPFEFLWYVPKSDEAAYRRGETVYTFARKPADRYKSHYWIWHDFKQFLENHRDMGFHGTKRKFKEEQKAKKKSVKAQSLAIKS